MMQLSLLTLVVKCYRAVQMNVVVVVKNFHVVTIPLNASGKFRLTGLNPLEVPVIFIPLCIPFICLVHSCVVQF